MPGSFAALYVHIVFSTKDRLALITPDLEPRLYAYMGGILRAQQGASVYIGGTADHTHVLTSLQKTLSVSDTIRDLKCNSSRWVHETFPQYRHFAWQEGYGVFSISVTGLERVKLYIAHQKEHHRVVTFKEEFEEFLQRHGIAYHPERIWD